MSRRRDAAGLSARLEALRRRHARLEADIDAAGARPLPDALELKRLKKAKLDLKDEMAAMEGVLRTLARRPSPRAGSTARAS